MISEIENSRERDSKFIDNINQCISNYSKAIDIGTQLFMQLHQCSRTKIGAASLLKDRFRTGSRSTLKRLLALLIRLSSKPKNQMKTCFCFTSSIRSGKKWRDFLSFLVKINPSQVSTQDRCIIVGPCFSKRR